MAGRTVSTNNPDITQAQIDVLGERITMGFAELKDLLKGYEERLRGLENREAGCQPLLTSRLDAAWRKIDVHDADISKVVKVVDRLETVAKWLLGIATALIAALVIAFATGQVQVIFK